MMGVKARVEGGKIIIGKIQLPAGDRWWVPRKDRGRPKDNQAGLPVTRGIGNRRSDGLNRNDRVALPKWSFPGSTQARLTMAQREAEYIEADDTLEQRESAAEEEGRLWEEHGGLDPIGPV